MHSILEQQIQAEVRIDPGSIAISIVHGCSSWSIRIRILSCFLRNRQSGIYNLKYKMGRIRLLLRDRGQPGGGRRSGGAPSVSGEGT